MEAGNSIGTCRILVLYIRNCTKTRVSGFKCTYFGSGDWPVYSSKKHPKLELLKYVVCNFGELEDENHVVLHVH